MKMRLLFLVLLLLTGAAAAAAQNETGSAPIVWERYKFTNTAISIMLPKMPVALFGSDLCHGYTKNSYFAYADNAVYEVTIVERSYAEVPKLACPAKFPFDKSTLTARLTELRNINEKNVETSGTLHGLEVNKFAADGITRWIVGDMDDHRWIELAIAKRADSAVDEDKFIDSLDIAADLASAQGKQVGLGSDRTLGDADMKPPAVADQPKTAVEEPVRIILKPRPSYTDDARKNRIQGTVRLRVALLANGAVGSIEVVKGVDGLNEQAIAAARKIVFLPKRVNGVNVSVVKLIEYGFSIY